MKTSNGTVTLPLYSPNGQRSPVQFLARALDISEVLQVFPTHLEMYWYETQ
ncbi:hypothetical protein DPMN_002493 [Dreissena polymorpha]|uniref:Uncharacterized protein n=1 Tax=Dreissena polymorpha TaxID=45954 RepID=A0A9D4RR99_DREPO|nr:hypothetical protein DPMN_002493 [Dreissena polymorpha]